MRMASEVPASAACLDGETIAAWAEHALRGTEAEDAERHLAECARCSALLAAFVRTIPEAPAAESLWNRWHLRWFVPLATAATAAAIWVSIPRDAIIPDQGRPVAQSEVKQETASARESSPAQPSSAAPAISSIETPAAKRRESELADFRARPGAGRPLAEAPSPAQNRELDQQAERSDEATRQFASRDSVSLDAAKPAEERTNEKKSEDAAAAAPAAPPAAAPRSVLAPARELAGLRARAVGQNVSGEILSPNPMNRWRITAGGQVQHSSNGGARWEVANIPSSDLVTSGSSPAPSVCWIVGRGGAVFVTTDGLRFIRLMFPEAIDLVSVRATDDRNATVITSARRAFSTTDRGATWTRAPLPVQ